MKKCTIVFKDEMNAKVRGLDTQTAKECEKALAFLVPHRFHVAAYKLGRWDGKVTFFKKETGNTYISVLDQVVPIIVERGYQIDFEDNRKPINGTPNIATVDMFKDYVWPKGHPIEGQPIILREDQAESANIFLERRYGLMCLPTSYGKTLLSAALAKSIEHLGRTLVIVPSTSLVEQTLEMFKLVGMDAGGIHGDRKEFDHHHTITTWQSVVSIIRSKDLDLIYSLVRDVVFVNVDECHQVKDTSELKSMLGDYFNTVPYRVGLTGTIPKQDHESLAIMCSLGPLIHHVPLSLMQELGFIAKCEVHNIVTEEKFVFKDYSSEAAHLSKDPDRLAFLASTVENIRETGNTLILVNSIESGKRLNALIPDSTFIYGKIKEKDRSKAYKGVNDEEHTVIIATFSVAAVGINIPRIFNLITLESGKSFIRVVQSIGRAIRIAKDKDFARVFDFSSNSKFSAKHLKERTKFYEEMEYPYQKFQGSYDACHREIMNILERPPLEEQRNES